LAVDRGWVQAGDLHVGEQVVRLHGSTNTVAAVRVVPGQADMYNLTVANDHTYAVGDDQAVVHNTGACEGGSTTPIGPSDASGGVYQLRDPETGRIMRTGQTNDLHERRSAHARMYPNLDFEIVYKTDNPTERTALEQMLYEAHPEADITQGGLNINAPIGAQKAIRFPGWYEKTMRAGAAFLERYGSGG
jgi:hypothetical protein